MKNWPKHPVIYEINTWVWLRELERKHDRLVDLATVPEQEWDIIAANGADVVWFMGVWERSPAGIEISMRNSGLLEDFRRALPDFDAPDNVGSPYCIRRYVVDAHLGGPEGLAAARKELAERGMGLILDFVPNHLAPDHPWAEEHPAYFIQGSVQDLGDDPSSFVRIGGRVFACGRDPYFPAWPDVLQLNAFDPGLRQAAVDTLTDIAGQCDGVRCDMAMLLMSDVFERTWGGRAGARPESEYWRLVIPAVKAAFPDFRFLAEAYWDLEWDLQQQGFDFCYDKRLYDRLEHGPASAVGGHLDADPAYQSGLVRFIENHDEPRAATAFGPERQRAAALVALTLPGAALVHEGQLEGRRVRLPVFLARRPDEKPDMELRAFYETILGSLRVESFRRGEWRRMACTGWPDNRTCENMLAWGWRTDWSRCLVVVNLSAAPAQAMVTGLWDDIAGQAWCLYDLPAVRHYDRDGADMLAGGLYVDLPAWGLHFMEWCPRAC
jgi:hypothetical protein